MMRGNDAVAESAIRAGCRFYSGYPITPQSEIMEYLSAHLPEVGGHFIQAESEIAGISMVLGAANTGYRVMTGSSGPGFSLKQEGISYLAQAELPAVIVNVSRYGCGLGFITPGQSDYFQVTKGGGHGDYQTLVYAPYSVQEIIDLMFVAFDKAEEHCNPVIMLTDGALGQMMEGVILPDFLEPDPNKQWAIKGRGERTERTLKQIEMPSFVDPNYDFNIRTKYQTMADKEQRWESYEVKDADVVLVAYGTSARVCKQAVQVGREKGLKLGLIRPITVWPFPKKAFVDTVHSAKAFLSVEMSALGQLVEDVALSVNGRKPVYLYPAGKNAPIENVILEMVSDILDGKLKEVF